ncbi:hypothetical protein J45TS6_27930 [Paenibacillus sp. J45TS6]|nr:hypothetical protein J45TS6_27930 [Paenibacillus sp. J45TS6]
MERARVSPLIYYIQNMSPPLCPVLNVDEKMINKVYLQFEMRFYEDEKV